jgi:hypothetical protein
MSLIKLLDTDYKEICPNLSLNYISVNDVINNNNKDNILICNRSGDKNILFIGSCRIIHYLNCFMHQEQFNHFNICAIMVHSNINKHFKTEILNENEIKKQIDKTDIFIHEHIENYDFLNTNKKMDKNFYIYKNSFIIDITLPNYPNLQLCLDTMLRSNVIILNNYIDFLNNELSHQQFNQIIINKFNFCVNKYIDIFKYVNMEDMVLFFNEHHKKHKLFHTINHISNVLAFAIYQVILKKYFNLLPTYFSIQIMKTHEMLGGNNSCMLSEYDKEILGYEIIDITYLDKEKLQKRHNIYLIDNKYSNKKINE